VANKALILLTQSKWPKCSLLWG